MLLGVSPRANSRTESRTHARTEVVCSGGEVVFSVGEVICSAEVRLFVLEVSLFIVEVEGIGQCSGVPQAVGLDPEIRLRCPRGQHPGAATVCLFSG